MEESNTFHEVEESHKRKSGKIRSQEYRKRRKQYIQVIILPFIMISWFSSWAIFRHLKKSLANLKKKIFNSEN